MKTIALIVLVIIVLAAAAVCIICTVGIGLIAREEDRQIQRVIEDDHDLSGLIEED